MSTKSKTALRLTAVFAAFCVLTGTACHRTTTRPWDDKVPTSKKPVGLIRIIPIKPLDGTDYPTDTLVSSAEQKLTLPSFPDKEPLWFALELSGWGTSGLRGFSADVIRVDSLCPRAPCGCMTSANVTSCSSDECAEGSACVSGVCRNAFVNKLSSDFVFFGVDHDPIVSESDPEYHFYVGAKGSDVAKYTGVPVIGGYLTISATDGCPDGPTTEVMFDTASPPFFVLGDGSVVYPEYKGAYIFFEP